MPEENTGRQKFSEKLRHNYRLVVMNHETFEEVGSYKLSLLNVYILISTVVVLVALLVIAIIVFTPVKRYIPGYGDIEEHAELLELNQKLSDMEAQIQATEAYTNNFRKILVGDIETYDPDAAESGDVELDTVEQVERIEEDELLRQEIDLDQQLQNRSLMARSGGFSERELPMKQLYFIPPVTGMISEGYKPEKQHYGVDVMAPSNTPIKSIMDGYVFMADWTLETGYTIGIQHAHDLISFYKHNSGLLKEAGNYVSTGEAVAIIGNTGTLSSGPHLHFELWYKGKPIDPSDHISFE